MKIAKKALVVTGLLAGAYLTVGLVAKDLPSALSAQDDTWANPLGGLSRGTPAFADDYGSDLMQLAQASQPRPSGQLSAMGPPVRSLSDFGPGPFAMLLPPPAPGLLTDSPAPMMGHNPDFALPPARIVCEEGINRIAALAAYIKSKLRLQGAQKDNWSKIEQAAGPMIEKMHEACDTLPNGPSAPLTMLAMLSFAGKQASARAEFLIAVSDPAQAFYDSLSTEQRELLNRAPPPMF
jgi:LTXXQ motif family protein